MTPKDLALDLGSGRFACEPWLLLLTGLKGNAFNTGLRMTCEKHLSSCLVQNKDAVTVIFLKMITFTLGLITSLHCALFLVCPSCKGGWHTQEGGSLKL